MTADKSYGGRYAVIERVGSGGMAEVYRARDELLGREVAVKVLSERLAADRNFVERFRREAQSAANLNHPNIVSLYDYGSDNGTYFIVMEYIDGRSLADVVRESGRLMPERAAEIAADVAKALSRAHAAGLVHRDVKPANIMITTQGQTKVTDFGIARALRRDDEQTVTQTGMVIGTASYLSPEQAQGNPVDTRSDVYSLGCVIYEMLTGGPPFTGDTPLTVAYKHVREEAEPPSRLNPDVPPALDAIVLKAMAKNMDNRYASATELLQDLERYLSGQKVMATPVLADQTAVAAPVGHTEVLREPVYSDEHRGKRPVLYVLVALAILLLFGVIAWIVADRLLGGNPVEVPRVVGLEVDDAIRKLDTVGLEAEIERRPSTRPEDTVFRQEPQRGETVEEGDTVTLFVSSGPRQVDVPRLVGLPLDEARRELRRADLAAGSVTSEASDEFDEDTVIRHFPPEGEQIAAGTAVDLVVSSGPEPAIVPEVVGDSEEQARAEIEAADLVADVSYETSDEPEGTVIAQDPAPGTERDPGDTVHITVSEGPEERPMPNVIGQDADDAEQMLEHDYGLDVRREEAECPGEQPGRVCDQDPDPGTPVSPGDDAILYVQSGEAGLPLPGLLIA